MRREADSTPGVWRGQHAYNPVFTPTGLINFSRSPAMPKATASPPAAPAPASYEAALAELEQLVARIESGQMPLDQLLQGYQRGAELLQFCRDRLQAVEQQIQVLDEGGLKPWSGA
jgi:exodeoxyribonuclease VII small subunit